MKVMPLEEQHACALEILKDIDRFCRASGIKYSLAYGTLLGAVRHKGFIPWDDDIDIVMPRAEYDRFIAEYKSDRYEFLCRENCDEVFIAFGRVVDMKETRYITTAPWHSGKLKTGVWVDIFPLDYVPDDFDLYSSVFRCFSTLLTLGRKCRGAHAWIEPELPLKKKLKIWAHTHLHPRLRATDPSLFAKDYVRTLRKISKEKTGHYAQLGCADNIGCWFETSIFDKLADMPFEGCNFLAPVEWDKCLKQMYGDYMQLPPKEKQVNDLLHLGNIYRAE